MDDKEKKFYWLRLKKDFFKRHDIRIIEDMPNGKDYVLFYLKLLCESVDHEGNLRFSEQIPYNDTMLSTITNTNIDIVRSAIKVFTELQLMEILDNQTLYMTEVNKMMGFETEWAKKKRDYREKQKQQLGQCPQNVLTMSDKSIEIEKDKELEIEIEKDISNLSEVAESIKYQAFLRQVNELLGYETTIYEKAKMNKWLKVYSYEDILNEIERLLQENINNRKVINYIDKALDNSASYTPKQEEEKPQEESSGSSWLDNWKKMVDGDENAKKEIGKYK